MTSLDTMFKANGMRPIEVDGQLVTLDTRFIVEDKAIVFVRFLACKQARQGVYFGGTGCMLDVAGVRNPAMTLYSDTFPEALPIVIEPETARSELSIFNFWDFFGHVDQGMGNAGMVLSVIRDPEGRAWIRYNSSPHLVDGPDFESLVFDVMVAKGLVPLRPDYLADLWQV